MNEFMNKFSAVMMPISQKISQNRFVKSISAGMMLTIPFTMVGAIAFLLAVAPGEQAQAMGGFVGAFFTGWANLVGHVGGYALAVYNYTLGLMAVIACAGIAYTLAKEYKLGQIECALVALSVFLLVIEGDSGYFGGKGIFTAIIVALVCTEIYHFCDKKNIIIKLPDSVPETISRSFSELIPFAFSVIVLGGCYVITKQTTGLHFGAWFISALQPALDVVDSYPVVLIICLFGSLLWAFGIHGHAVIMPIFNPIIATAMAENLELVSAGQAAVFHPVFLVAVTNVAAFSMWIVAVFMIKSKSTTLNAIGKATIIPGLFIMEPVFFGTPIALNFILMIPYVLLTFVNFFVFLILYKVGFLPVPYVYVGGITPLGLGYFLQTQNAIGFLIPWIQVLISIPVWIPFFKVYEKQCIEEEKANEAAE